MARYDFYRRAEGDGYLLDVQADLLKSLNTRVVIPLMPPTGPGAGPPAKPDLHDQRQ
ncbi:CcdB family protein [Mesorhizobium sp. f-mel]